MENKMEGMENNQNLEPVDVNQSPMEINKITSTGKIKTGHRRILVGRVVSNKSNKTIVIRIERYVQHPLYKKYFKRVKKVMAHDENNECQIGDLVKVMEYRPLSRRKRWMLTEIVERAK